MQPVLSAGIIEPVLTAGKHGTCTKNVYSINGPSVFRPVSSMGELVFLNVISVITVDYVLTSRHLNEILSDVLPVHLVILLSN